MMTGLTLTQFTSRSNLVAYAFVQEKVECVNFLETIVACELKFCFCSQLMVQSAGFMILRRGIKSHNMSLASSKYVNSPWNSLL